MRTYRGEGEERERERERVRMRAGVQGLPPGLKHPASKQESQREMPRETGGIQGALLRFLRLVVGHFARPVR